MAWWLLALAGCEGPRDFFTTIGSDDEHAVDWRALHGSFWVSFVDDRAVKPMDPYAGTKQVVIELAYDPCVVDFYQDHPAFAMDGEVGVEVFGDGNTLPWYDRCDRVAGWCRVVSLSQELSPPTRLSVTFEFFGLMQDRPFEWGPVPRPALSGCPLATAPISENASLYGLDAAGQVLWDMVDAWPQQSAIDDPAGIQVTTHRREPHKDK